jgi:RNA-binding protein PNO1
VRQPASHRSQFKVSDLFFLVRFNTRSKTIELKTSEHTTDPGALQRGEDYLIAYVYGFDIEDAIALLKLDDL